MSRMRREDVLAYLNRDRTLVEESRAAHWASVKRRHGAVEGLRIAEALRLAAVALRPEWPTPADRALDLAVHERVSEALRRVPARRPA